jgi:hypothetical protein
VIRSPFRPLEHIRADAAELALAQLRLATKNPAGDHLHIANIATRLAGNLDPRAASIPLASLPASQPVPDCPQPAPTQHAQSEGPSRPGGEPRQRGAGLPGPSGLEN